MNTCILVSLQDLFDALENLAATSVVFIEV